MTPEARLIELEERVFRLTETLRAIVARGSNWQRPATSEYFRAGQLQAYMDVTFLAQAGLRWAEGRDEEP